MFIVVLQVGDRGDGFLGGERDSMGGMSRSRRTSLKRGFALGTDECTRKRNLLAGNQPGILGGVVLGVQTDESVEKSDEVVSFDCFDEAKMGDVAPVASKEIDNARQEAERADCMVGGYI